MDPGRERTTSGESAMVARVRPRGRRTATTSSSTHWPRGSRPSRAPPRRRSSRPCWIVCSRRAYSWAATDGERLLLQAPQYLLNPDAELTGGGKKAHHEPAVGSEIEEVAGVHQNAIVLQQLKRPGLLTDRAGEPEDGAPAPLRRQTAAGRPGRRPLQEPRPVRLKPLPETRLNRVSQGQQARQSQLHGRADREV